MLCPAFTRNIQNTEKAHCLFQRKVNIWSHGRGTVTVVQYGSEGEKKVNRKVKILVHNCNYSKAFTCWEGDLNGAHLVFLKQFI